MTSLYWSDIHGVLINLLISLCVFFYSRVHARATVVAEDVDASLQGAIAKPQRADVIAVRVKTKQWFVFHQFSF